MSDERTRKNSGKRKARWETIEEFNNIQQINKKHLGEKWEKEIYLREKISCKDGKREQREEIKPGKLYV